MYQSRRLARPIDRLAVAAARLGDGDFTIRSEPSGVREVDEVSQALDTTAQRLEETLSRERAFTSAASHQLRTPLTGLRVNLEAARLDPAGDLDGRLDTALAEVDRLERTIDDLLALARDTGTPRSELDVEAVLATVEEGWHGRLATAGRTFRVATEPDLPPVEGSDRAGAADPRRPGRQRAPPRRGRRDGPGAPGGCRRRDRGVGRRCRHRR